VAVTLVVVVKWAVLFCLLTQLADLEFSLVPQAGLPPGGPLAQPWHMSGERSEAYAQAHPGFDVCNSRTQTRPYGHDHSYLLKYNSYTVTCPSVDTPVSHGSGHNAHSWLIAGNSLLYGHSHST